MLGRHVVLVCQNLQAFVAVISHILIAANFDKLILIGEVIDKNKPSMTTLWI